RTQIELHFAASDVYLVMSSDKPVTASVKLVSPDRPNHTEDIDSQGNITIQAARLYHIVNLNEFGEGQVLLQFNQPGVKVYSFTFGG
ncbi:MAG: hypothetical protein ACM3PY_12490, partial [Omnitrophica WOR_2 bacterium]